MLLLPILATLLALTYTDTARAERWQPPLPRVTVLREFDFDARAPFAAGARRGVRLHGVAGAVVRAPCGGTVVFAGRLPRLGPGVSLRCRRLVATEFGLERISVRRGAVVLPGAQVGTLGARGALYLGARVADRRWGYRDPLTLLGTTGSRRPLGPAPAPLRRGARPPRLASQPYAPVPLISPLAAPLLAWLGLGVAGVAAGLGTTLGLRARRARVARARHAPGGGHGTH